MSSSSLSTDVPPNSSFQDLPTLVDESLIRPFKFWDWGVKTGMLYHSEIYVLCQSFSLQQRFQAYDTGFRQMMNGKKVCITVSKAAYSVWVGLQSAPQQAEPS